MNQLKTKRETQPVAGEPAGRAALFQPTRWQRFTENTTVLGLIGVVIFLLIWELTAALGLLNPVFTSRPTVWGARLFELLTTPELGIYEHTMATLLVLGIGLLLAVVTGIPLGILTGWFKIMNRLSAPMVTVIYGVPYIALLPIIIIWFGIGDVSRILIVFWAAFFPILINTTAGVSNVDPGLVRVGRAFCASQWQLFRTVITPGSVPYVVAGLRLAIGRAIVAAIVAEFFMASRGLGYFINARSNALDSASSFAGLVLLSALGLVLVGGVARFEGRFSKWKA